MLLRLIEPDAGEIFFKGQNLLELSGSKLRAARKHMQMIVQDRFSSLDPRMRVGEIVSEPLAIHEPQLSSNERRSRALAMLDRVGLKQDAVERYPHEFWASSAKESALPALSFCAPNRSSLTSRFPPWTSPSALKFCCCCRIAARVRPHVHLHFLQPACRGTDRHAHRRHARRASCRDRPHRGGPAPAHAGLYLRTACRRSCFAPHVSFFLLVFAETNISAPFAPVR